MKLGTTGRKMDDAWKKAISEGLKKGAAGVSSASSTIGNALKKGVAAASIAGGTAIARFKAKGDSNAITKSEGAKRKSSIANLSTAGKIRRMSNQVQDAAKSAKEKVDSKVMSKTGIAVGDKLREGRAKLTDMVSRGGEKVAGKVKEVHSAAVAKTSKGFESTEKGIKGAHSAAVKATSGAAEKFASQDGASTSLARAKNFMNGGSGKAAAPKVETMPKPKKVRDNGQSAPKK